MDDMKLRDLLNVNKMKEVTIYEFQLRVIRNALSLIANTYDCRDQETALKRMVIQAERFAQNALNGEKDKTVRYGKK